MAKEFVERETLLNVIRNNVAPMYYKDCLKCIAEAPAANVAEVKRGHWKMEKRKNLWGEYMDAVVCSERMDKRKRQDAREERQLSCGNG